MASADLVKYIEAARAQQMSDDEIKAQLVKLGWKESEVLEVLNPEKKVDTSLIPPPAPHIGMWVSFQYILFFYLFVYMGDFLRWNCLSGHR